MSLAAPKPRIGALLLASGWMRDVGLDGDGSGLARRVGAAAREIGARLAAVAEVTAPPVAASAAEAARAAAAVLDAGCDCALVVPLVWCEDQVLRTAVQGLHGLPVVLGTLLSEPRLPPHLRFEDMLAGSGVVGTLQASGMLAADGVACVPVTGWIGDPAVYDAIAAQARAAAAARGLRGARVGLLPHRCEQMSVTWVDADGLRGRYGAEIVSVPAARLADAAARAAAADVAALHARLEAAGFAMRTDAASLDRGLRAALALGAIAAEERLDGVALNDLAPSVHESLGLRPCLSDPALCERGVVVSMEADVAACLAMSSLRRLCGTAPFYSEIYNAGLADGCLLMGHAGWHDPAVRDPSQPAAIVPDEEYRRADRLPGAAMVFKVAPGPVTAVNAVWRAGRLAWSALEGESLAGPAPLDGSCHLVFRAGEPVPALLDRLITRGVSQHWIVVPGHRAVDVEAMAYWMEAIGGR
jgi:L-fucose isomerase-like protein